MDKQVNTNKEYFELLDDIKKQIELSKIKANISIDTEMILMYHKICTMILEKNVWGSKFIKMLSKDLRLVFLLQEGFSASNLKCMQQSTKKIYAR